MAFLTKIGWQPGEGKDEHVAAEGSAELHVEQLARALADEGDAAEREHAGAQSQAG